MILPFCFQSVDSVSPDGTAPTSSNLHRKLPIGLLSTLFRLDPPLPDHKKTDEKPVGEFL